MDTARALPKTWLWTGVAVGSAVCGAIAGRRVARPPQMDRIADGTADRIAHHLRTPLTSIICYTDAVLSEDVGPVNPDQRRMLGTVDRNADSLHHTIADLLTVSYQELGADPRGFEPVDMSSVVERAVLDLRSVTVGESVRFDAPGEPMMAMGDMLLIVRIVRHLIGNAQKFSPGAEDIDVDLRRTAGVVELRVTDRGIGVPADELHRLTEPFFRSSRSQSHDLPGLGLGLAVAKSIVELHNGTLRIEPVRGGGTTVTLRLPVATRG